MEWQLIQLTSPVECEDRRMCIFPMSLAWQERQWSRTWLGGRYGKRMILDLSPIPLTCSSPGPWQPSQPVSSGRAFASAIDLKCGLRLKPCHRSGWQVWQTWLPMYLFGSGGVWPAAVQRQTTTRLATRVSRPARRKRLPPAHMICLTLSKRQENWGARHVLTNLSRGSPRHL